MNIMVATNIVLCILSVLFFNLEGGVVDLLMPAEISKTRENCSFGSHFGKDMSNHNSFSRF